MQNIAAGRYDQPGDRRDGRPRGGRQGGVWVDENFFFRENCLFTF